MANRRFLSGSTTIAHPLAGVAFSEWSVPWEFPTGELGMTGTKPS